MVFRRLLQPLRSTTAVIFTHLLLFGNLVSASQTPPGEASNEIDANIDRIASWGVNSNGQLGIGDTDGISKKLPILIPEFGGSVTDVAAGECHGVAATESGEVWVWGCDSWGSVPGSSDVPVKIPDLNGIVDVSAGRHSNALTEGGLVWEWGLPYIAWGPGWDPHARRLIEGPTNIIAIDTGERHNLALKDDGRVFGWGDNIYGQAGNVNGGWPVEPIPNLSNIVAIAAGYYHSLALDEDGTVWGWGLNDYGQVGDGSYVNQYSPVRVRFSNGAALTDVTAIAAAGTYSLALRSDGTVWAWGSHKFEPGSSGIPYEIVKIQNLPEIGAIAAGARHSLAIGTDGSVWAWGEDANGQLGDGEGVSTEPTVQSLYLKNATAVAAGDSFSMAINRPFRVEDSLENENAWVLSTDFPMSEPDVSDNWAAFYDWVLGEYIGQGLGAILGVSIPGGPILAVLGFFANVINEMGEQWDPVFVQPIIGGSTPYRPDQTCITLTDCLLADVCEDYSTRLGAAVYLDFVGRPTPSGPHDPTGFEDLTYYVGCRTFDARYSWVLIPGEKMKTLDTTKTYVIFPKHSVSVNDLFMSVFCWPPREAYYHAVLTTGLREDLELSLEYVPCIRADVFSDGFETGNTRSWSGTAGAAD